MNTCYLCGSDSEITDDHVPPKSFFPKPRPSNLITIPCCRTCNQKWGKEDEAIRAYFSLALNRSPAGDEIWNTKVVGGILSRSPAFREMMLANLHEIDVKTPHGSIKQPAIKVPEERVTAFMVRMTKGMLREFYPEFDDEQQHFGVNRVETKEQLNHVLDGFSHSKYIERGDGVFKLRFERTDTGRGGSWLFVFYDAIIYWVCEQPDSTILNASPPGTPEITDPTF